MVNTDIKVGAGPVAPKQGKAKAGGQGKLLKKMLKAKKVQVQAFADAVGVTRQAIYDMFGQEELKKDKIAISCALLGATPADFGLPADYLKPLVDKPPPETTASKIVLFDIIDRYSNGYDQFLEEYMNVLTDHVKQARRNYTVVDYFHKKRGIALKYNGELYNKKDKVYFKIIEDKLDSQKGFQYSRISQLPYSNDTFKKLVYSDDALKANDMDSAKESTEENHGKNAKPLTEADYEKAVFEKAVYKYVEMLFPHTFEHICNCFQSYPDNFNLYLLSRPLRLFNIYIVDDKYVMSEYDRYNSEGFPVPDMLFVNGPAQSADDNRIERLIKHHKDNFKLIGIDMDCEGDECTLGKFRVTKEMFISKTKCLNNHMEDEITKLKTRIKKAEEAQLKEIKEKGGNVCYGNDFGKIAGMQMELTDLLRDREQAASKLKYLEKHFFDIEKAG